MRDNGQVSNAASEWSQFWTLTISTPRVPIMIWFYGMLYKALTLTWLGYGVARGVLILYEHGAPEAFLIVMFQILAATIIYFLGDGLCNGERTSVFGVGILFLTTIVIAVSAVRLGYHIDRALLAGAMTVLFVPPIVSGIKNFRVLS